MRKRLAELFVAGMSILLLLGGCGGQKTVPADVVERTVILPEETHQGQEELPKTQAETQPDTEEPLTAPKEEKEKSPHQHQYQASIVAATCTAKGYTLYSCSCGDSYRTDETAALGHDYQTSLVAATTDAQGYTLHRCSRCGDSYQDNYTEKLPSPSAVDHWTLEGGISPYDPIVKEYAHNYDSQQAADVGNAYIQSLGLNYCSTMNTDAADYTDISFGGEQIWLKGGQAWYNEQAKAQVDYTKRYLDEDWGGSERYQLYCTAGYSDYMPMYVYGVTVWFTVK